MVFSNFFIDKLPFITLILTKFNRFVNKCNKFFRIRVFHDKGAGCSWAGQTLALRSKQFDRRLWHRHLACECDDLAGRLLTLFPLPGQYTSATLRRPSGRALRDREVEVLPSFRQQNCVIILKFVNFAKNCHNL